MNSFESIFYIKDAKGKYLLANNSFRKNLTVKDDYVITGKTDIDFYSKIEAGKISKEDISVIKHGEAVKTENYIPGSKNKWGIINKTPILDAKKKVLGLICNITDITQKRKDEKALHFLLEKIQKNTEKMYYGIYDLDSSMKYQDTKLYEKILGVPTTVPDEQHIEYFLRNIVHPDDKQEQEKYYSEFNFPPVRKFRIIHPQKGIRWIKTYNTRIQNMFISYSVDITDEKEKCNNQ